MRSKAFRIVSGRQPDRLYLERSQPRQVGHLCPTYWRDRPLQITRTRSGMITGVSWSPDGRLLAFGRCGDQNRGAIYTIPALSDLDRKLTDIDDDRGEAQAAWTPDGQSLVFSDACTPGGSLGIAVFTLATRQKRCLVAPDSNVVDLEYPTVSPDGTKVAFIRASTLRVRDIFTVPLRGGGVRRLTSEGKRFGDLMWTSDGKNIVFTSDRGGVTGNKWWGVSAEGGPIKPAADSALPASVSLDQFSLRLQHLATDGVLLTLTTAKSSTHFAGTSLRSRRKGAIARKNHGIAAKN